MVGADHVEGMSSERHTTVVTKCKVNNLPVRHRNIKGNKLNCSGYRIQVKLMEMI
jgi:hypothetical protein